MFPIPSKNALLIPSKDMRHVSPQLFSRSRMVTYQGTPHVVVPFDIPSCAVLRQRGLKPPGPIRYGYTWPMSRSDMEPFTHQIATADFLTQHKRAFVFNDIGTGKTLASLWAADYLMSQGMIKRVLIASTLSTLWRVWDDEIYKSFRHRTATVLHGSRERRSQRLAEKHDFYIINHEGIEVMADELAARDDIDLVIMDEGARYRNSKTSRFKVLQEYCGPATGKGLWWMTGSPMPKAPTDIWAQARMVNPQAVPKYFSRFRDQTMTQINMYKWVPKQGWEDYVYSTVQPCIRFTRDECIDIDQTIVEERDVEMSPKQIRAYEQMKKELVVQMESHEINAVSEGVKLGKLLQIATGAIYDGADVLELQPTPKLAELKAVIEELGNKAIVFTPYKHSIKMLATALAEDFSVGAISGDVGAGKRSQIFHDFQSGGLQVIVAHPQTMAHGLTLTASRGVVWFAPIDDYEIYEQANGRITRPGQTFTPLVIHLVATEIERKVYARLRNKEKMQGLLLTMLKSGS